MINKQIVRKKNLFYGKPYVELNFFANDLLINHAC